MSDIVPYEVPVKFEGTVTVLVPKWLADAHPELARILADKWAVCHVRATLDNPYAPADAAFEEFEDAADVLLADKAERAWDGTSHDGVSGTWSNAEPEYDWRENLHPGDEITWVDPDDGACSRQGTILTITYKGNGSARIRMTDGWESDVMLHELQ